VARELAIDLGTASTLVYRLGDGIVFDQPTVVALDPTSTAVVAVGDDAWRIIGGGGGEVVGMRPLRNGSITEFEVTQRLLEFVIRRTAPGRFPKPRVLITVATGTPPVERRALEEAVNLAGGKNVTMVEEPLAAAIGAGLPIQEPIGSLIVDIGGARSEMAVVSMGGIVSGQTEAVGGFDLDVAIQEHVRERYGVAIGERAADEVKRAVGSAFPIGTGRAALVVGRELASGNTVEVRLDETEVRQAMADPIGRIVEAARRTLAEAPPELTHDVLETGMFLMGGGALLTGLDLLLSQECEVPVHIAEHPREAVARGAGHMLEHIERYRTSFQLERPVGGR
jgi:rod shape-determining protein MreB and related proteins